MAVYTQSLCNNGSTIIINYLLHILIIITTRYIVYYILCALVITEEKAHMNCVSNHIILLGKRSHNRK